MLGLACARSCNKMKERPGGTDGRSSSTPLPSRNASWQPLRGVLAAVGALLMLVQGEALASQEPVPVKNPCTIDTQPTGRERLPRAQADWAWLCRYRTENERLQASEQRPQGVFIGDSITERWPSDDPDFFTHGRVSRGIGGQTSAQILLRFQQDAIALKPRYIHLLVGTNDVAGNAGAFDPASFQDNMRMMATLAKRHRIKLFLGSIPPADRIYWREQADVASRIKAANDWLRAFAARERIEFIDYYTDLTTNTGALRPEYTEDGVHPNAAGYAVMKRVAARHLPDLH